MSPSSHYTRLILYKRYVMADPLHRFALSMNTTAFRNIFFLIFFLGPSAFGQNLCEEMFPRSPYEVLTANIPTEQRIKILFEKSFSESNRTFLVLQLPKNNVRPGEKNRDKAVFLRYGLVDTKSGRTIWQMDEFFKHRPFEFILDPLNINQGFIIKTVEKFFTDEEAPPKAKTNLDYPGLFSFIAYEIIAVKANEAGELEITEIFSSDESISGAAFVDGGITVVTRSGTVTIPRPQ